MDVVGATTLGGTLTVAGASTFNGGVTFNPPTLNILPAGMIMAWVSATAPTGWLICNGGSYSTTGTYANLFAVIQYTFGGSGSSFNVPNYQGAFLRGTGNQTKNYNSTAITYTGPSVDNTGQSHATQVHSHGFTDPGHFHETQAVLGAVGGLSFNKNYTTSQASNTPGSTNNGYNTKLNTTGITINNSASSAGTITDTTETRPFNFGVYWVIKF